MLREKQKTRLIITAFLIAVFTLSSIGVGIFMSTAGNAFQTSILRSAFMKKNKHKSIAAHLIAQIEELPEIIDPSLVCNYTKPAKPEYKGEFVAAETKVWGEEDDEISVSLYIKNTGNTAWFGDSSGCSGVNLMRLGTVRDRDRASIMFNPADSQWIASNRIAMVEPRVDPGELATFAFSAYAPRVSDIFREYFQPVIEGVKWLDRKEETAYVDMYVGETYEEDEKKLFYLGKSGQASSIDLDGPPVIDIDISEQKLKLKLGEAVVREYAVSTGTFKTPTPLGTFKILNKQELRIAAKYPHYRMPKWQGFTKWGHGFHSLPYLANDKGVFWNEALNHIGQRVSHGCIRLLPEDAEDFYSLTEVGTEVVIHN